MVFLDHHVFNFLCQYDLPGNDPVKKIIPNSAYA